jgi:hypothetical protein
MLRLLPTPGRWGHSGVPGTGVDGLGFAGQRLTHGVDGTNRAADALLRRFVASRSPTPNPWSDAWLAAHAEALGYGLTSLDADFRSFRLNQFDWLRG